jgi:hypothetical protein
VPPQKLQMPSQLPIEPKMLKDAPGPPQLGDETPEQQATAGPHVGLQLPTLDEPLQMFVRNAPCALLSGRNSSAHSPKKFDGSQHWTGSTQPGTTETEWQAPAPQRSMVQELPSASHDEPFASNWHVDEQQSPLAVFPSSHCSPQSRTPLPHASTVHVAEHPSHEDVFPSSQASHSVMPLPQLSTVQVAEQPSHVAVLPSSHCSPADVIRLPQAVVVQFESQPSPSTRLPSSHCSGAVVVPLPQILHEVVQPSVLFALPSSHSSPASVTPSPHGVQRPGCRVPPQIDVQTPGHDPASVPKTVNVVPGPPQLNCPSPTVQHI